MKRREFLITSSIGAVAALAAGGAYAQTPAQMPWEWTDENGLARFLKVDTNPLENEFEKYPRCPYCGMVRKAYSFSRHLIVYSDDAVDGTCSIRCAAVSLALNLDRMPKTIYAGDAGSDAEIKPLVDVANATYLIDPKIPGTMSPVSKFAYAEKARAEAAAAVNGGTMTDFDGALRAAYNSLADDTIRTRKSRADKRAAAKM